MNIVENPPKRICLKVENIKSGKNRSLKKISDFLEKEYHLTIDTDKGSDTELFVSKTYDMRGTVGEVTDWEDTSVTIQFENVGIFAEDYPDQWEKLVKNSKIC